MRAYHLGAAIGEHRHDVVLDKQFGHATNLSQATFPMTPPVPICNELDFTRGTLLESNRPLAA